LNALGRNYAVWDTHNTDIEPDTTTLAAYKTVIWFTGGEFGGTAGPGPGGETALGEWLSTGKRCLLISSQDYYWDRGLTPFMDDYLGVLSATSDVTQIVVTGAGSVFSGLGPFTLNFDDFGWNYSDRISPDSTAELAFSGDEGDAAVNKDNGIYQTAFFGFPFESIASTAEREEVMAAFLNWCGYQIFIPMIIR
jgi:hypothetical protein